MRIIRWQDQRQFGFEISVNTDFLGARNFERSLKSGIGQARLFIQTVDKSVKSVRSTLYWLVHASGLYFNPTRSGALDVCQYIPPNRGEI